MPIFCNRYRGYCCDTSWADIWARDLRRRLPKLRGKAR